MRKIKKITLISVFCLLFLTSIAQAALVPCGGNTGVECTWCHLMILVKNIVDFMIYLAIPLAIIMIIVGGIMIMTAGGSTERASKGRQILTAALTGLIIVLFSYLIIDTIIKTIGQGWDNLKIGPWNKLEC
ncbi:hypothetical protein JW698_01215 [Candidatus Wolfebacteria bacterium]|nr:hypothetical protein [Candidatus Wolfebacteria bacterium]